MRRCVLGQQLDGHPVRYAAPVLCLAAVPWCRRTACHTAARVCCTPSLLQPPRAARPRPYPARLAPAPHLPPIQTTGLVANVLVENLSLGPVAPFDAAATVLAIGGVIIAWTWSENYGDASSSSSTTDGFKKAAQLIWNGEGLRRGRRRAESGLGEGLAGGSVVACGPAARHACWARQLGRQGARLHMPARGLLHMLRRARLRLPPAASPAARHTAPCSRPPRRAQDCVAGRHAVAV